MGDYSMIKTPSPFLELTFLSITLVLNWKPSYGHPVFNIDIKET